MRVPVIVYADFEAVTKPVHMFPQRLKSDGARVTYALGDLVGKGEPAQGSSNGSKS